MISDFASCEGMETVPTRDGLWLMARPLVFRMQHATRRRGVLFLVFPGLFTICSHIATATAIAFVTMFGTIITVKINMVSVNLAREKYKRKLD